MERRSPGAYVHTELEAPLTPRHRVDQAPATWVHRRPPCGTPAYLASTSNYAPAPFIFVCRYSKIRY